MLSKISFYLTILLVLCIVVIATYLAIVTINEVIRNPTVIYASPPVQLKLMNEIQSDIYHICKTNTHNIELKIFKFVKMAPPTYFFLRMCLVLIEYFINP